MRVTVLAALILAAFLSPAMAGQWEKQAGIYFLAKDGRESFSAQAAGPNKFASKYLTYDGIDFLVRGQDSWRDYGRLNLDGNNVFSVPIRAGMKVDAVHVLAGGNVGNSYAHDPVLRLFGDRYYYAVLTLTFAYQDGGYKALSVPVIWDWFPGAAIEWANEGARIKYVGRNPARKDALVFHISFVNPRPSQPVKDILLSDSWIGDYPFSEVFALTLKSGDELEAAPRQDRRFTPLPSLADNALADSATAWPFDTGLDGWSAGCSANWGNDAFWQADSFGRKGAVVIPGCNQGGDRYAWIEKKIALPDWDSVILKFLRHSGAYSDHAKAWTDGSLKVTVRAPGASAQTVSEQLYSGEWGAGSVDLSQYKGRTVIVRLENHGGGTVKLGPTTSCGCDAEEALIADMRLVKQ